MSFCLHILFFKVSYFNSVVLKITTFVVSLLLYLQPMPTLAYEMIDTTKLCQHVNHTHEDISNVCDDAEARFLQNNNTVSQTIECQSKNKVCCVAEESQNKSVLADLIQIFNTIVLVIIALFGAFFRYWCQKKLPLIIIKLQKKNDIIDRIIEKLVIIQNCTNRVKNHADNSYEKTTKEKWEKLRTELSNLEQYTSLNKRYIGTPLLKQSKIEEITKSGAKLCKKYSQIDTNNLTSKKSCNDDWNKLKKNIDDLVKHLIKM